jgi:hypothetical protein
MVRSLSKRLVADLPGRHTYFILLLLQPLRVPPPMDVLLRWKCDGQDPHIGCEECGGSGYREQWLAVELLPDLTGLHYIILDRRHAPDQTPTT